MNSNVLEIENLKVHFKLGQSVLHAVDGVDLAVREGASFGVIGESGSGKSVTAQAILRIVPKPGEIVSGKIRLRRPGENRSPSQVVELVAMNPRSHAMRRVRGGQVGMVFQEPMTSLSPVHTIGDQLTEAILLHRTVDRREARDIAAHFLDRMKIPNPTLKLGQYPHNLSGGMRQRVMIAMAVACKPSLLIADEPTTALDVTVQAQILELMKELQAEFNMAIMYITHDLGVVAEISEHVAVMYLGRVVETGDVRQILKRPQHPYTKGLVESFPRLGQRGKGRLRAIPGNVTVPIDPPWQCGFYGRCPVAIEGKCNVEVPALVEIAEGHKARCFHISDLTEERPLPIKPRTSLFA